MARALTSDQRALLRSPSLRLNVLATFYLDSGTYRFCDDTWDMTDGVNTYIGASALAGATDITTGSGLSAESVTLTIDGNRMAQFGIDDPAAVLRDILNELATQRRVDLAIACREARQRNIGLILPVYGGKINQMILTDTEQDFSEQPGTVQSVLSIELDSIATRYRRASNRTRSHADQLQIDPNDDFFSFTADAVYTEKSLYWGKKAPNSGVGSAIAQAIFQRNT